MAEKKIVFVAYTNSDCTEGRGYDIPIAICESEATARRLARKQYVQGSDGPVRTMELLSIDGKWYAPSAAINIVNPTKDDIEVQKAIDTRKIAIEKARAAGLTDSDLAAIGLKL